MDSRSSTPRRKRAPNSSSKPSPPPPPQSAMYMVNRKQHAMSGRAAAHRGSTAAVQSPHGRPFCRCVSPPGNCRCVGPPRPSAPPPALPHKADAASCFLSLPPPQPPPLLPLLCPRVSLLAPSNLNEPCQVSHGQQQAINVVDDAAANRHIKWWDELRLSGRHLLAGVAGVWRLCC